MKAVALIQARMGSTRLPGKVLQDIGGMSMLARVVRRTARSQYLSRSVLVIPSEAKDDCLQQAAETLGLACFRGSENDVLDRYYQAACAYGADPIVRITADCPLIDAELIDQALERFTSSQPTSDFLVAGWETGFPRGLEVEIASLKALTHAWQEAQLPYQRTHVFPYLYENPNRFQLSQLNNSENLNEAMRWTVDTPEDLEFVRSVYQRFDNRDDFSWRQVTALLQQEPELAEVNKHVRQKEIQEG